MRESGLDYSTDIRIFVLGPKGLPPSVQAALNAEFVAALASSDVNDRLTGLGLNVSRSGENTVANLKKHIDEFAVTYGKLIAEMGIKAE